MLLARELLGLVPAVELAERGAPLPSDFGSEEWAKRRAKSGDIADKILADKEGAARATAEYERTYAARIYRLLKALHAAGHITEEEEAALNRPVILSVADPPVPVHLVGVQGVIYRGYRLVQIAIRLGAKP